MRWMHLSDIHFGYTNSAVDTMRKKLIEKARELEKIDRLFITGDLRYGKNMPLEYSQETIDFLLELRTALNLSPSDVHIVPGNHDVERCDALTAVIKGISEKYSTQNGEIDEESLKYIRTRREAFRKLYHDVCGRDEPTWHYCEQRDNFNIICLNTAILCGQDGEDGDLIIGSELLNQLAETVDKSKPGIVLAHHDFDALRLEEQQKLEITLKEIGATLYLCGHKHVALSRLQNTYRTGNDLRVFLCGTNMDQAPGMSQTDMDFFIGQTEDGSTGWVQAYKWYPRTSLWLPDNEFSSAQNEAIDGRIYFPKENRPSELIGLRQDVLDRYRAYIRLQCGEIELNGLPINEQEVSHRFALRRLFVPLRFSIYETMWQTNIEQPEKTSLIEPISGKGISRKFILSDPGGGKSTLLKWIASVYCFPEEYHDIDTFLPKRELFPVWLRCRDIPEGSRPSIWKMIKDIAIKGEWLPHGSDASDFAALVAKYIVDEKLLLLIDGLDEIGADEDRAHFVEQLSIFADLYPQVSILVSSRPTGLPLIIQGKFKDFQYLQIDPLNTDDIKDFCLKWNQVVRGDTAEVRRDAEILTKHIAENERILRLASNPMLLTTLLLVERRAGKLPTKRVELYEEAIQVLLETWNSRGYAQNRIDLDEARYQLSYVAYHMTTRRTERKTQLARITRSELIKLLRNARRELAELISGTETVSKFIQNIERRSALLIQKGYEENSTGKREAVYEFQHLTFQEYLASYAVLHCCYPGATENDDPISVLAPHLTNPNMREVISLIAVRLTRFYPGRLVDEILDQMEKHSVASRSLLRKILLQFVADEVALSSAKIDEILENCFVLYYCYEDKQVLQQILEGKNAERLMNRFQKMDCEQNEGFDYHRCVLDVLAKKISDPIRHYLANRKNPEVRERANAVSVLVCPAAFEILQDFPQDLKNAIPELKTELFDVLKEEDPILQQAALWGLQDCSLINTPDDWSQYIENFTRYANKSDRFLCVVSSVYLPETNIPYRKKTILSEQGSKRILNAIVTYPNNEDSMYDRHITLAFIGVLACDDNLRVAQFLQALRDNRKAYIKQRVIGNNVAYYSEKKMHRLLNDIILNGDFCDAKKKIIVEHILKTDIDWAREEILKQVYFVEYTDYSTVPPVCFSVDVQEEEKTKKELANQVLSYIQSRMDEEGIN